jgi:hypothetical protein
MSKVKRKMLLIPAKFHTVLKSEANLEGKTMTRYMDDMVRDVENDHGSVRAFIKREKKIGKNDKKKFNFGF